MNFNIGSTHFKVSLSWLAGIALLLFALFARLSHRLGYDSSLVAQAPLPHNIEARVTYNPKSHVVTTQTKTGVTTQYTPGNAPIKIDVNTDGSVKVYRDLYGFSVVPFIGVGYSDTTRIYLGADFAYIYKFGAFGAFGFPTNNHSEILQPLLGLSYNIYSNTSINFGLNPVNVFTGQTPQLAGFVSVKF